MRRLVRICGIYILFAFMLTAQWGPNVEDESWILARFAREYLVRYIATQCNSCDFCLFVRYKIEYTTVEDSQERYILSEDGSIREYMIDRSLVTHEMPEGFKANQIRLYQGRKGCFEWEAYGNPLENAPVPLICNGDAVKPGVTLIASSSHSGRPVRGACLHSSGMSLSLVYDLNTVFLFPYCILHKAYH